MIYKVRRFSLKQKDFASGKMVSPPREMWEKCDCCGKAIVQGVEMSNGDKIGFDCAEVVSRAPSAIQFDKIENLFKMFGTPKRVQEYALRAAS